MTAACASFRDGGTVAIYRVNAFVPAKSMERLTRFRASWPLR
jgi:hypothetical protein